MSIMLLFMLQKYWLKFNMSLKWLATVCEEGYSSLHYESLACHFSENQGPQDQQS
jgi:hypothetical protein